MVTNRSERFIYDKKSMPHGVCCVSRFRFVQVLLLFVFVAHSKVMSLSVLRFRPHIGRGIVHRPTHIFPTRTSIGCGMGNNFIRSFAYHSDIVDQWPKTQNSNSASEPLELSIQNDYVEPACLKEYTPPSVTEISTNAIVMQGESLNNNRAKAIQTEGVSRRTRVPAVAPLSREQLKANANSDQLSDWEYVSSIPIDPVEVLRRCTEQSALPATGGTDMEVTFIGTASCNPSFSRGVSCVALRHEQDVMLFDCGEGAQLQLMRAATKISRIKRIFITHLHGDHAFGLAGVLCMMGQAMHNQHQDHQINEKNVFSSEVEPIDIYGPEGIRDMVRAVVQLSYSMIVPPHRIHELKNIPKPKGMRQMPPARVHTHRDTRFNELDGGRDIYPDDQGHYHLYTDKHFTATAASMVHSVPCVGFVLTEHDKPGALRTEVVEPIILANKDSLNTIYEHEAQRAAVADTENSPSEEPTQPNNHHGHQKTANHGRKGAIKPRKKQQPKTPTYWRLVYKDLKALKPEDVFRFPDGTVVTGRDVMDPLIPGRKVVYMGDTCSAEYIENLAQNCDVLIHEATNAFFPGMTRFHTQKELENNTKRNGHSTPEMAAQEAYRLNAKTLLMTHFSTRHLGDAEEASIIMMMQIEGMAKRAYAQMRAAGGFASVDDKKTLVGSGSSDGTIDSAGDTTASEVDMEGTIPIVAAYDFMRYPIHRKGSHEAKE